MRAVIIFLAVSVATTAAGQQTDPTGRLEPNDATPETPPPNPRNYPRVVHRDGLVCVQRLVEGAVRESCRDADSAWTGSGATRTVREADSGWTEAEPRAGPLMEPSTARLVPRRLGRVNAALMFIDSASLKRSWAGPFKFGAIGTTISGVFILATGGKESTAFGVGMLAAAVVSAIIGAVLDYAAKSDIAQATMLLGG